MYVTSVDATVNLILHIAPIAEQEWTVIRMKRMLKIALIMLALTGCVKAQASDMSSRSRFAVLEEGSKWMVVVDTKTGVMYSVSNGWYNHGTFTLLVDAEGKPLIYDGRGW